MAPAALAPSAEDRSIRKRRESGADRYDEVWDGVHVMSPAPDPQHQGLGGKIYIVLDEVVDVDGLGTAHFGVNVSDRFDDWTKNYRVPDVAVFLEGSTADHCGPAFVGGPDFLVEIRSDDDPTWEKVPFYERIGVRELLVVERDPWKLTRLRLVDGRLREVGVSTTSTAEPLRSEVVPLSFRLAADSSGATVIEVSHHDGARQWTIVPKDDKAVLVRWPAP